jgi:diguanylate cyclase (GGDEF)-like protein/putative nucleotidyltransferase with HDIG domain
MIKDKLPANDWLDASNGAPHPKPGGHVGNKPLKASKAGRGIITVRSDTTIVEAAKTLASAKIGCLVVTDDKGALAGVFTERDIASRVLAVGLDPARATVQQAMSSDVISVRVGTPMERVEELMNHHHIRHLPVTAAGRAVGMISSRDVIAHQVQTSQAKQRAAEQIAMLSTSLRNLDFDDVVAMILREVPRIFSASRALAFFSTAIQGREGTGSEALSHARADIHPRNREKSAAGVTTLIKGHHCLCPEAEVNTRRDVRRAARLGSASLTKTPPACRRCKAGQSRILIPLNVTMFSEGKKRAGSNNYLCLCDFAHKDLGADVLNYKATLAREVLSYNLSHARLWQDTKSLLLTDTLTGAGTRKVLETALESESARAIRYHRTYCVAMLDIDRFKSINDTLGHQVGDRVLAQVSHCLQTEKRATDILVRYGGDEFVLLLPEMTCAGAVRAMERLRTKVKAVTAAKDFPISFSCGVAEFIPSPDMTSNELVRRADMALYRAKKLGRDRIETWENVTASGIQGPSKAQTPQLQALHDQVAVLSAKSREFFLQSVRGLVEALEARDAYTKSHSDNVLRYAVATARVMGLSDLEIETVRVAAMVHDIGKLGIPDSILLKPGKLTSAERHVMEEHPLIAVRILDSMRFLERELPAVRNHHERWDGGGYPDHLAAMRIPLEARILAAADAFDAMTSMRAYHQSRTVTQAQSVLRECSGTQFDPDVVAAFTNWIDQMKCYLNRPDAITPRDLLETRNAA